MFSALTNTIKFNSQNEQSNPIIGQLLADTGALPAGRYVCWVLLTTSAAGTFLVNHRNADDDATEDFVYLQVPANDSRQFVLAFALEENERLTVTPLVDLTANVTVSIVHQRLS